LGILADKIEGHIKEMLALSAGGIIELRRTELAEAFMCVPSQINYVLETRFTNNQGYHVESRRGGGGFLRIVKLLPVSAGDLEALIESTAGQRVSQRAGEGLLARLVEEDFLTRREGILVRSLIGGEMLKDVSSDAELLRGRILQAVLVNLLRSDFEKEGS